MTEVAFFLRSPGVVGSGDGGRGAEEERSAEDSREHKNFNEPSHSTGEFTANQARRGDRYRSHALAKVRQIVTLVKPAQLSPSHFELPALGRQMVQYFCAVC